MDKVKGISVIICCYNSRHRIKDTLIAISRQKVSGSVPWEVIIVDNASTDDTEAFSRNTWDSFPKSTGIPFSICYEPVPGLANARRKGIACAKFAFVVFCDDDNWLCEGYVQGMFDILSSDPNIAACGGKGIPFFEGQKPVWFDYYSEAFAVGDQGDGKADSRLLCLYGAGMAVRIGALQYLSYAGFEPLMVGRTGKKLSSAEDTELTNAFVLAGFKLQYSESFTFTHFLGKDRLTFPYLVKLFTAFGSDGPVRNLYYSTITGGFRFWIVRFWVFHLALACIRLVKYFISPPKRFGRKIYLEWSKAYIAELFSMRRTYRTILKSITDLKVQEHPLALHLAGRGI